MAASPAATLAGSALRSAAVPGQHPISPRSSSAWTRRTTRSPRSCAAVRRSRRRSGRRSHRVDWPEQAPSVAARRRLRRLGRGRGNASRSQRDAPETCSADGRRYRAGRRGPRRRGAPGRGASRRTLSAGQSSSLATRAAGVCACTPWTARNAATRRRSLRLGSTTPCSSTRAGSPPASACRHASTASHEQHPGEGSVVPQAESTLRSCQEASRRRRSSIGTTATRTSRSTPSSSPVRAQ